jgi:site-specific DNA-cytosine methylase
MRVLIACEFSGIVRDAFSSAGHDAWSCDLLQTEREGKHIQGDIRLQPLGWLESFDLIISHPPCTYLASSGARWWAGLNNNEQALALDMVHWFMYGNTVPMTALENPIGIISRKIRKPDQIIQPWMFGEPETKATCLWLKGLPKLVPTNIVEGREPRVHRESPGKDRWKRRSRTLSGIANAMASQWGGT